MGNQMTGELTTVPAYKPTAAFSAAIALNSPGLTNIVNVTEEGKLSSIGIYVATAATGTPTATLEIQVDGQTTESIALLTAGISFQPAIRGWASGLGVSIAGVINSTVMIPIGLEYQASLRVGINVSVAGSGGSLDVTVMRGRRL